MRNYHCVASSLPPLCEGTIKQKQLQPQEQEGEGGGGSKRESERERKREREMGGGGGSKRESERERKREREGGGGKQKGFVHTSQRSMRQIRANHLHRVSTTGCPLARLPNKYT